MPTAETDQKPKRFVFTPEVRDLRERLRAKPVTIYNVGTRTLDLMFDGELHRLHGKGTKDENGTLYPYGSCVTKEAAVAWHWLGDPMLRPDPQEWGKEIERLQCLHGFPVVSTTIGPTGNVREAIDYNADTPWKYITDGNLFWQQDGTFYRGTDYYKLAAPKPKSVIYGQAIVSEDLSGDLTRTGPVALTNEQLQKVKSYAETGQYDFPSPVSEVAGSPGPFQSPSDAQPGPFQAVITQEDYMSNG